MSTGAYLTLVLIFVGIVHGLGTLDAFEAGVSFVIGILFYLYVVSTSALILELHASAHLRNHVNKEE